jgi:hypothetical protein
MACQASPELAEAGKIVLIPIAKTSNARTINIISCSQTVFPVPLPILA